MSRSERRAYLHAIAARRLVAGRAQKSRILDEYCATVRVSRKHAIAMIGRTIKALADEAAGCLHRLVDAPEDLGSTRLIGSSLLRSARSGRRTRAPAANVWSRSCRTGYRFTKPSTAFA